MSSHQEIYEEFKERFVEESRIRTRGRPHRAKFGLAHYPQFVGAENSIWCSRYMEYDAVAQERYDSFRRKIAAYDARYLPGGMQPVPVHRTPGPFWWAL